MATTTSTKVEGSKYGLAAWGLLILLSIIWGSSYILIKRSLVAYDPIQVACLRLSVSAIAFSPIFFRHIKKLSLDRLTVLILVGITGSGLPSFLFAIAQTRISSSMAGSLSALTPLFTLLIGILFFSVKPRMAKILGIGLGLVGALMLILFGQGGAVQGQFFYGFLVVLAAVCYAISSNLVGYKLSMIGSIQISAFSLFIVGVPALIYLFTGSGFTTAFQTHPEALSSLIAVTALALLSTVFASIVFFQLIKMTNPVFSSTVSYLIPAVAIFWGSFDGEAIDLIFYAGLVLILVGVYLSRKG